VASLTKDPAASNAAELMRLDKLPTTSEVKAGKSVFDLASFFQKEASTSSSHAPKRVLPPHAPGPKKEKKSGNNLALILILSLVGLGVAWFFFL